MAFIVFEGIDGSGKSSLIQRLSDHLTAQAVKFLVTREPGGSPLGDQIRKLLLDPHGDTPVPRAELLLYQASRAQHVEKKIKPALDSGWWVICDRFTASSIAFQAGARGLKTAQVEQLNDFATGGLQPDLTVLLDLDPLQAQTRREGRAQAQKEMQDRFEQENLQFHESVRLSYLAQAKTHPLSWLILNAGQSAEQVYQDLAQHLRELQWPGF